MVKIQSYSWNRKQVKGESLDQFPEKGQLAGGNLWIDVSEYTKEDIDRASGILSLDPLTAEDILEGGQRVKVDEYSDYVYLVSKGVSSAQESGLEFTMDEISIVIRENLLVTFHEKPSMIIENVSRAVLNATQEPGKDNYFSTVILHLIYDFSVDSFYEIASSVDSWLLSTGGDILDIDSMKASDLAEMKNLMRYISRARRRLNDLRIVMTQFRDVTSMLQHGSVKFVTASIGPQFRDIYDHTFQLIETLDSYMLRTSDLRDLYFTLRAAFTDNILKFLTIVATIFLPLTFLTGFYGMNFTSGFYQPGSSSIYGFYGMVAVMMGIGAFLAAYFRKKGWL
ncbi:MAG: magnesium transporter CorA family protein [Candidatus Thermoplasmatota archaeon]|nr:magnesium transporter CorA family protein [Candidatus Thermoplasmatota archaeon]